MDIIMTEDGIDSPQGLYLSPEVWSMIGELVRSNPSIEEPHSLLLHNLLTDLSDTKSKYAPRANKYMSLFLRFIHSVLTSQIHLRVDRHSLLSVASKTSADRTPLYPRTRGFAGGISWQGGPIWRI